MAKILFPFILILASNAFAGELYVTSYLSANMAARADGGNPNSGIGLFQVVNLVDGLNLSGRVEALLGGKDRDGSGHPFSIRYTVKLRYDYTPIFIEVERFAWNPISHVSKLPAGMKESIGGGDTMSSYAVRGGIKW